MSGSVLVGLSRSANEFRWSFLGSRSAGMGVLAMVLWKIGEVCVEKSGSVFDGGSSHVVGCVI